MSLEQKQLNGLQDMWCYHKFGSMIKEISPITSFIIAKDVEHSFKTFRDTLH